MENCLVLCNFQVKFSLFPRSLTHLTLDGVRLSNLPQTRLAITASPFFCIKKVLPLLARLELREPHYLRPCDSLAIIRSLYRSTGQMQSNVLVCSGSKQTPGLEIEGGRDQVYSWEGGAGDLPGGGRVARRDAGNKFLALMDFHFSKRKLQ